MRKPVKAILPERVKKLRADLGISQAELAKRVGVTQQSIGMIERGKSDKPTSVLELARALKADPEYLFGDQDSPRKKKLYATFDPEAPEPDPVSVEMTMGSETGARGIPEGTSPQLDVTAGMGGGGLTIVSEGIPGKHGMTFAAENISDFWRVPPIVLMAMGGVAPADITFVPVQGDSMVPTLQEGDVVVVDTRHRWPSPAGVYALNDPFGGIIVKRLEITSKPSDDEMQVAVISDNAKHPPQVWSADELRIVGRVLRKFGNVM